GQDARLCLAKLQGAGVLLDRLLVITLQLGDGAQKERDARQVLVRLLHLLQPGAGLVEAAAVAAGLLNEQGRLGAAPEPALLPLDGTNLGEPGLCRGRLLVSQGDV